MAEAKMQDDWLRLSVTVAKIHNVQQTKRSNLLHPDQINPFSDRNRRKSKGDIGAGRRQIGSMLSARK